MNSNRQATTDKRQPLGVFDSGIGGLSVLREITRILPHEDIVYYADSGNCPYGTRPPAEIQALSERVATFLLSCELRVTSCELENPKSETKNSEFETQNSKLKTQNLCKALVVACNTASTVAVGHLRQKWPEVPIVGMVPAVKPAASLTKSGIIAVLATEATSHASALLNVIDRFANNIEVLTIAPPGLVELIEAGEIDTPETEALLRQYLAPVVAEGADALVLGCTHFPFLRPLLAKIVGDKMQLIDSGEAVARQTRRVLEQANLLNPQTKTGGISFYTSGDPTKVGPVIARLLGYDTIPEVAYQA